MCRLHATQQQLLIQDHTGLLIWTTMAQSDTRPRPSRHQLGIQWIRVLTWRHQLSCKLKLLSTCHTSPMVHLHLQPGTEVLGKSWCTTSQSSEGSMPGYLQSRLYCAWATISAVGVQQQVQEVNSNGNSAVWTRQRMAKEMLSFKCVGCHSIVCWENSLNSLLPPCWRSTLSAALHMLVFQHVCSQTETDVYGRNLDIMYRRICLFNGIPCGLTYSML